MTARRTAGEGSGDFGASLVTGLGGRLQDVVILTTLESGRIARQNGSDGSDGSDPRYNTRHAHG